MQQLHDVPTAVAHRADIHVLRDSIVKVARMVAEEQLLVQDQVVTQEQLVVE